MNALDGVLGTRAKVAILRTLSRHSGQTYTGHQLAREVGMSPNTVHRALHELSDAGIVETVQSPHGHEIRLAADSELTRTIKELFTRESGLKERLVKTLRRVMRAHDVTAVLFGSVARGEATSKSDLDLLIVAPNHYLAAEAAQAASQAARKIVPMPLKSIHLSTRELREHHDEPWLQAARNQGIPLTRKRLEDHD